MSTRTYGIFRLTVFGRICLVWILGMVAGTVGAEPLTVFVSVLPQKYFVQRIGGENVRVEVMVGPGQSPATYEPTPKQMARLSGSAAYFYIGVPFENAWLRRLASLNPRMRLVDCRAGVGLGPDPIAPEHEEQNGHAHLDPHIWTDPRLVAGIAGNIHHALVELDPAYIDEYGGNYRRLQADLTRLDSDIRSMVSQTSVREFMVFHPAWGHFAHAYGLRQIAIQQHGKEPGASTVAGLIRTAQAERIPVIFVQPQFADTLAQTIAQAIGAQVVQVDPLAGDYIANLRRVARQFLRL